MGSGQLFTLIQNLLRSTKWRNSPPWLLWMWDSFEAQVGTPNHQHEIWSARSRGNQYMDSGQLFTLIQNLWITPKWRNSPKPPLWWSRTEYPQGWILHQYHWIWSAMSQLNHYMYSRQLFTLIQNLQRSAKWRNSPKPPLWWNRTEYPQGWILHHHHWIWSAMSQMNHYMDSAQLFTLILNLQRSAKWRNSTKPPLWWSRTEYPQGWILHQYHWIWSAMRQMNHYMDSAQLFTLIPNLQRSAKWRNSPPWLLWMSDSFEAQIATPNHQHEIWSASCRGNHYMDSGQLFTLIQNLQRSAKWRNSPRATCVVWWLSTMETKFGSSTRTVEWGKATCQLNHCMDSVAFLNTFCSLCWRDSLPQQVQVQHPSSICSNFEGTQRERRVWQQVPLDTAQTSNQSAHNYVNIKSSILEWLWEMKFLNHGKEPSQMHWAQLVFQQCSINVGTWKIIFLPSVTLLCMCGLMELNIYRGQGSPSQCSNNVGTQVEHWLWKTCTFAPTWLACNLL